MRASETISAFPAECDCHGLGFGCRVHSAFGCYEPNEPNDFVIDDNEAERQQAWFETTGAALRLQNARVYYRAVGNLALQRRAIEAKVFNELANKSAQSLMSAQRRDWFRARVTDFLPLAAKYLAAGFKFSDELIASEIAKLNGEYAGMFA